MLEGRASGLDSDADEAHPFSHTLTLHNNRHKAAFTNRLPSDPGRTSPSASPSDGKAAQCSPTGIIQTIRQSSPGAPTGDGGRHAMGIIATRRKPSQSALGLADTADCPFIHAGCGMMLVDDTQHANAHLLLLCVSNAAQTVDVFIPDDQPALGSYTPVPFGPSAQVVRWYLPVTSVGAQAGLIMDVAVAPRATNTLSIPWLYLLIGHLREPWTRDPARFRAVVYGTGSFDDVVALHSCFQQGTFSWSHVQDEWSPLGFGSQPAGTGFVWDGQRDVGLYMLSLSGVHGGADDVAAVFGATSDGAVPVESDVRPLVVVGDELNQRTEGDASLELDQPDQRCVCRAPVHEQECLARDLQAK